MAKILKNETQWEQLDKWTTPGSSEIWKIETGWQKEIDDFYIIVSYGSNHKRNPKSRSQHLAFDIESAEKLVRELFPHIIKAKETTTSYKFFNAVISYDGVSKSFNKKEEALEFILNL